MYDLDLCWDYREACILCFFYGLQGHPYLSCSVAQTDAICVTVIHMYMYVRKLHHSRVLSIIGMHNVQRTCHAYSEESSDNLITNDNTIKTIIGILLYQYYFPVSCYYISTLLATIQQLIKLPSPKSCTSLNYTFNASVVQTHTITGGTSLSEHLLHIDTLLFHIEATNLIGTLYAYASF